MRWPIRNQILLPFALLLLTAVATIAIFSSALAVRRSERETSVQLRQVIQTLGLSSFPWSENVLQTMRGLSGAEFVSLDAGNRALASTLERVSVPDELPGELDDSLRAAPMLTIRNRRYFAASVQRHTPVGRENRLLVLYPEQSLDQIRLEAALPPLIVGGVTVIVMALVSAWIANRLSRRIARVQRQVAAIAGGEFGQIQPSRRQDEIQELVQSVNSMSAQLARMESTIQRTERARLLAQLASGLAHQLRNAVTGSRMAVQIHQRRCRLENDESLDVALRQLLLTEEELKRLLSVGRRESPSLRPLPVAELLRDIRVLTASASGQAGVDFATELDGEDREIADSESVRTAVLNLILNAIEAAGPGGIVRLTVQTTDQATCWTVADSGPGPPPELAETLLEPFVTSKPEGVGLGLALVRQVADQQQGRLSWTRENEQTVFRLELPHGN